MKRRENELCLQYHAINTILFKIINSIILCFALSVWLYHMVTGVPANASQRPEECTVSCASGSCAVELPTSDWDSLALPGPDMWLIRDTTLASLPKISAEPRSLFRRTKRDTHYEYSIGEAANKYGVEPAIIKAVIMAESSFNPRARSKVGAQGLMQLMPRTARSLGVKDAFDPHHNIHGGAKYLKYLLERYNGDVQLALAAYNAGSRNVRRYNGVPPFKATQAYITKVLQYYEFYKEGASGGIS